MVRRGHTQYGVATLLAFDCLLRVSELMALRLEDIADAGDARMGSEYRQTTVVIRQAKTGRNQSVTVWSDEVKVLLRPALDARVRSPRALLFSGGAAGYRRVFKAVCAELGLSERYVPHSLRHGGATRLYLRGERIEDIMIRGRWASTTSARLYVQASKAMLMSVRAPREIARAAVLLAADVPHSFALAQLH
jgi:integrase